MIPAEFRDRIFGRMFIVFGFKIVFGRFFLGHNQGTFWIKNVLEIKRDLKNCQNNDGNHIREKMAQKRQISSKGD